MQLQEIPRTDTDRKARRVGRGGRRGKTSGRGHKGQKARAGHRIRPQLRDIIKKIPRLRGRGVNVNKSIKEKPETIDLTTLENNFSAGDTVTSALLVQKGLVARQKGRVPSVKVLGGGDITIKLSLEGISVSAGAKAQIEKAGGTITLQRL